AHTPPEEREEPEKIAMLNHSARLLHRFLTLYPTDPLADDAAFSEANVYFALKDYANVVEHAARGAERHADSELKSSFEYMAALGHFWQRHYKEALTSATSVSNGDSKDRDYARYITAQIYHATGKPADAMTWYEKVRDLYPPMPSTTSGSGRSASRRSPPSNPARPSRSSSTTGTSRMPPSRSTR
ncbi:MAG: tetratricopeptide repeat protein, partial [Verrucomicrobiales bacterium]